MAKRASQPNQQGTVQTEQMTQPPSPAPVETGKEIAASITTHPDIDVNSERSHVNDAVEQPDNQTKRNPRTAKRGRRKKSADVPADAAQTGAD